MAEHNGDNRGGNDRGGFRGNNNSGGDPRGFRSRTGRDNNASSGRSAAGGERKPFGDRDKKPFGDRPRRDGEGDRRGFGGGERKPFGDRDKKPFGDRPRRDGEGDRRNLSGGERKPFGDRDRKPYGDRDRSFGDRPRRDGEGDRRSFGGGERKPFGDRDRKPYGDRENRSFGDRPRRDGEGDRRSFGGGENRKPFGDRSDRPARGDRQDRAPRSFDRDSGPRSFDRDSRPRNFDRDAGPRTYGRDRQEERPARVPNMRDLRSANRPDRERSPQIDEDVTGKELDRATQHQIKTLEGTSAEWVARHLVMAGRLIDDEPELAFQHALAASRRGGRLAVVREAVGLTAYAAGHYGEALREFRTYRRISGSNVHLPVMADCERGLGRPDRALDVVRSEEAQDLDAPGKAELAIVAAGARTDLGQLDAAVAELEIPQLDINRAFSYSPRLFRAYADALAGVGRTAEAEKWQKQAVVAENALGLGVDEEPDIIDLGWDEQEEAREEAERRRLLDRASTAAGSPAAAEAPATTGAAAASSAAVDGKPGAGADEAARGVDASIDDQEPDYFVSDDAESDEDSVETDELDRDGEELPDGSAPEDHQDRRED
jgi:tetratricopeptide (TPR) repeat protein